MNFTVNLESHDKGRHLTFVTKLTRLFLHFISVNMILLLNIHIPKFRVSTDSLTYYSIIYALSLHKTKLNK